MRTIETDGVHTAYAGILDDPPGKACVVQRIPSTLLRDPATARTVTSRIGDLLPIRHPSLLGVLQHLVTDEDQYVVSEWSDMVRLADVVAWCNANDTQLPHNLFLHFAAGICNALEAIHGRPGAATGSKAVLHLGLDSRSIGLTRDGQVMLGNFGLTSTPTTTAHSGGLKIERLYISPEQTHLEQDLTAASDLFSLGAVLYEILTLKPMFAGSTPLRTIAMVRGAEVTTQLLEIKEVFPGLDRVMYRVMAQNPRHRYQRAFVLREDLRALMAGFSFSNIDADARAFLAPMFAGEKALDDELQAPFQFVAPEGETTLSLLDDSDGIEAPRLRVEEFDPKPLLPPVQALRSRPPTIEPALAESSTLSPPPAAPTAPAVPKPSAQPSLGAVGGSLVILVLGVVVVLAIVSATTAFLLFY